MHSFERFFKSIYFYEKTVHLTWNISNVFEGSKLREAGGDIF
jgi:hypothetical protein